MNKLWIIPNEDEILLDVFEKDIKDGISYLDYIQEFSDKYMLGLKFDVSDYQVAPCRIAILGHMVVKFEEKGSIITCYLPLKVTDKQYSWIYQNMSSLRSGINITGYSLTDKNSDWIRIDGINEIMKEAQKKNILNEKGMKK